MSEYIARCFCGAVEFTVTGEPAVMGYCHCSSCRHWSGGPVNAFSLWAPESVKVTKGEQYVGTFNKTPMSFRKWCTQCGGHLFAEHPPFNMTDVFAAMLPNMPFKPVFHANYQESVLRIRDGLPKLKDFPKEIGGSGETMPE
ncbi:MULTISPECIES: GFA family protein [Dyella]|uniref:GFA family protein n=2 Tax=Dyella TaxID=231454 RepID=A0A4R0YPB5_9GAMM|nr:MULTISPECIES: GFA family protein [Dyella]TBR37066.1 GFA family protein [Dyella terrae]TCI07845.1 GFA family protein [Dyella soli]